VPSSKIESTSYCQNNGILKTLIAPLESGFIHAKLADNIKITIIILIKKIKFFFSDTERYIIIN
tara:strand:+ start:293 stop:484 length:192 start_codon:yes stop_codon:yes gene_type:complete